MLLNQIQLLVGHSLMAKLKTEIYVSLFLFQFVYQLLLLSRYKDVKISVCVLLRSVHLQINQ